MKSIAVLILWRKDSFFSQDFMQESEWLNAWNLCSIRPTIIYLFIRLSSLVDGLISKPAFVYRTLRKKLYVEKGILLV
jgi:hypothetical protein